MHNDNWLPGAYPNPLPRSWYEFVMADLQHAIRLIQKTHPVPIDTQFRLASRNGHYFIALPLGQTEQDRLQRMKAIKDFMAWKGVSYFIMVSQTSEAGANTVTVTAICAGAFIAMKSSVSCNPLDFSKPRLLAHYNIERDVIDLLPRMSHVFPPHRIRQLNRWFGPNGKYPAVFTTICSRRHLARVNT